MSKLTRLLPSGKKVHVEADIPASQLDEFDRAITALVVGERPGMDALARDEGETVSRAMTALRRIEESIETRPYNGQARRLGKDEVHKHLTHGERDLHRWMQRYHLRRRES